MASLLFGGLSLRPKSPPQKAISYNLFRGEYNDEDIKDLGMDSGILLPEEELLRRGLPNNFSSLVWIMKEVYGRYGGWFSVDHYITEDENVLHLQHFMERKWSIYLSNFFTSMFKTNLDIDVNVELREESVTFYISNKQIKTPN